MKFRSMRALCGLVCAAALALLASCGGGDQVDPFDPERLIVFGDEASVITEDGKTYTVQGLDDDGNIDCTQNRIWVMRLSDSFDLTFAECNPNDNPVTNTMYAQPGATVADVVAQIDAHFAAGRSFGSRDLVTVMVGTNDVRELYAQYPTLSEDEINAELTKRARTVAAQVNRIVDAGGKVLLATIPSVGLTPFARNEPTGRGGLLEDLTETFNSTLRLSLPNDSGRNIGLVSVDRIVRQDHENEDNYGLDNVDDAACTVALPNCTTDTLLGVPDGDDADPDRWLWADDFQLSPRGHEQVGNAAEDRAKNNPF